MKISQNIQNLQAFAQLTPMQKLEIIQIVGTRNNNGKLKSVNKLRNECFEYFINNK